MKTRIVPLMPPPRTRGEWITQRLFLGMTPREYLDSLWTPGHVIAALILLAGLPIIYWRFTQGLRGVTNLSDTNAWGLWISVDVMCGVALAAGGFVTGAVVHFFGLKEYAPLLRPAILTGFLGYVLVVVGLVFDLGRPWRLPYPMFVSFGTTSVMYEVGWCVFLYLACQFVEMLPPILEWLGRPRLRTWAMKGLVGTTAMAVMFSTLHQSSLGALFLIAPTKLHPLWYSMYVPVFFLISAISGGIGMIIIESSLSHRFFRQQLVRHSGEEFDRLLLGLAKAGAVVLYLYLWLKVAGLAHDHRWADLFTPLGYWWLVEVLGFVLVPCLLFTFAVRGQNVRLVRIAAVWTVAGLILNRINIGVIAFNYYQPDRYVPTWMEITITVWIVTLGVLLYQWIVNRMPILVQDPSYPAEA